MVEWKRYRDLGRISQMRNEGRELLGHAIYWTEKRDGSNISFSLGEDGKVKISSHNMEAADSELVSKVILTAEYPKICCDIMQDVEFANCILYFELIPIGRGPTRCEPAHKRPSLVLFDIFNVVTQQYLPYNYIHQVAHKYRVPIVRLFEVTAPACVDEIYDTKDKWLKWCKRHRREGVVGKLWKPTDSGYESFYFKEKTDLPKLGKLTKPKRNEIQLPRMPDDKIASAIGQAEEECVRAGNPFNNPKFAMPLVALHLNTQAKEHDYAVPGGFFQLYQAYLESKRKKEEST